MFESLAKNAFTEFALGKKYKWIIQTSEQYRHFSNEYRHWRLSKNYAAVTKESEGFIIAVIAILTLYPHKTTTSITKVTLYVYTV